SSVITCIDGYKMAQGGRPGPALARAAIGSFFAGTVCTALVAVVAPPLSKVALEFGSTEYFSLMLMGLVTASALSQGSLVKSLAMMVLGLSLSTVGIHTGSGVSRYTFGIPELFEGIDFVCLAVGVFAITEIIKNLSDPEEQGEAFKGKLTHLYPTKEDLKVSAGPILRGTVLGAFLGLLPGTGTVLATFSSYALEKKVAKDPSQFGHGAIQGVAGPEAANNADAQCRFIPMLTLGIPVNATTALLLGALAMQGIIPGPEVITRNPDLFWGLITSMWLGNAMLVLLNLPLIGIWVSLLRVPYRFLFPAILIFSCIGVYSVDNNSVPIYVTVCLCIAGLIWKKLECSPMPFILGFVLGKMLEEHLVRAMVLSRGDISVFFTSPISLCFMIVTATVVIMMSISSLRKLQRKTADSDSD
ncbi:MAG: tripartite tricarboxylate transporter permease, partial [Syntrophaceae bacterium]|nr:tripartite tricarboxylate transporter permease [Syntrophaceae bacterium]